jgi:hypothetical protein
MFNINIILKKICLIDDRRSAIVDVDRRWSTSIVDVVDPPALLEDSTGPLN